MNMEASLRFYVDGLGFMMTKKWTPDGDGKVRWCWLKHGGAALMLQEYRTEGHDSWKPEGKVGIGVSIYFICKDALAIYREVMARGIKANAVHLRISKAVKSKRRSLRVLLLRIG
jgi:lactoylglutathione lyase